MADGLLPLGDTGWQVWQSAALRGPGFPADGLTRLSTPDCAAAADVLVNGGAAVDEVADFASAFAMATAANADVLRGIAADPLFREAVTWQSLSSLEALDGLVRQGPAAARNSKQRQREIVVTRYWQRYCGKNDTIGFFGPACWARFEAEGAPLTMSAGPGLVRSRVTDLEWRVLDWYQSKLALDPRLRPLLPVTISPHVALVDGVLCRVDDDPLPLTQAQAAALASCDGRRPAVEVADLNLLTELEALGFVRWGVQLPLTIDAETVLRQAIEALADEQVTADFERLCAARDRLARAAGDPEAVRAAMLHLQQEFVAITDGQVQHRPGATYAGRGLSYEETERDLDVTLGASILTALAPAMTPLLVAARWLTAAIAEAFTESMRELSADGPIALAEIWHEALGLLYGPGPVADVQAEFVKRWSRCTAGGTLTPAELAHRVEAAFPAEAPGWSAGRLHSPDLHLCAESAEALARGEFTAVLGELHVAWITINGGYLTRFHPDPASLRAALHRDLGDRVLVLHPSDYPQFTARLAFTLDGPDDLYLGYTPAPTPDPSRVLSVASLTMHDVDGVLMCSAPDGRSWPLVEVFSSFLSYVSGDSFKLGDSGPHTPRVTVGNLVLHRETWRTTVGDVGLDTVRGEAERYLAVRRWRARRGLPERVFVRVGTEIKPCFVDFTSPAYVAAFAAMTRSAQQTAGSGVRLSISEMLPTPEQAWVRDGAGRRYFSELRMAVRDPVPARSATSKGHTHD